MRHVAILSLAVLAATAVVSPGPVIAQMIDQRSEAEKAADREHAVDALRCASYYTFRFFEETDPGRKEAYNRRITAWSDQAEIVYPGTPADYDAAKVEIDVRLRREMDQVQGSPQDLFIRFAEIDRQCKALEAEYLSFLAEEDAEEGVTLAALPVPGR